MRTVLWFVYFVMIIPVKSGWAEGASVSPWHFPTGQYTIMTLFIGFLVLQMAVIVWLVTEVISRKRTEQALKDSESKFRNLFESSMDAIVLVNKDKALLDCNPSALQLFGVDSKKHFMSLTLEDLSPKFQPDGSLSAQKAAEYIQRTISYGSLQFEWRHQRVNGEEYDANVLSTSVEIAGQIIIQASIRDITDQKRALEMMVQSEKMMSIGGLAAGMAHEINNPLGTIMSAAQTILRRISPELEKNREIADEVSIDIEKINTYLEKRDIPFYLNGIREAGERAAAIVRNMLDFSRKSESIRAECNIHSILDKALELASNDYDLKKKYDFRSIQIIKQYANDLPRVSVIETEIGQVFLNLLKNAAQAIMQRSSEDKAPRIMIQTGRDEGWIWTRIEDNGPGMDAETRKRIFEPFFTTKTVGEGTGLGLSVSYFIVTKNHKGQFLVDSQIGLGTTFTIRLPLQE